MNCAPHQPHYGQPLLRRLIWQTKDIEDLVDLCRLYNELDAQGDITITARLRAEVKIQQEILLTRQSEEDEEEPLNQ